MDPNFVAYMKKLHLKVLFFSAMQKVWISLSSQNYCPYTKAVGLDNDFFFSFF